ncbi:MAG: MerR family transcriptional regulator [Lachnospiraceae bacterium]|nr:MerR family transcriptional regulator [Lachnospiraceae bacterium]
MKIGDFARACKTNISVLRHYDKIGLLKPLYIDRFTEYRYYDESQVAVFQRISELKAVGFTLAEIRAMLYADESVEAMFAGRKAEIEKMLHDLEELKEKLNGGIMMEQKFKPLIEDVNVTFENDEQMIGKWLVLGKDEGRTGQAGGSRKAQPSLLGDNNRHLYFLPNGEFYWCFGWTKGKLIFDNGQSKFLSDYRVEKRGDDLYAVIQYKTQDYPVTGETTPIVLRKLDDVHYSKEQITRKDDVNKAFVSDDRVLGKWKAFCYFDPLWIGKEDFVPYENPPKGAGNYLEDPYFKEIEFMEGGHVKAVYRDQVITGDDKHVWTKGYWLRKWNSNACAYEIKKFEDKEYLIIEWKSGDYRFGGRESSYYVMVRE